jgi:hypothetical protein
VKLPRDDRLDGELRERRRLHNQRYRERHHEKILAKQRAWRDANREHYNATIAAWRRKNPDKWVARTRAGLARWRKANPEKCKAYGLAWRAANRDKCSATQGKRLARQFAAPGRGITADQWGDVVGSNLGLCAYCNKQPGGIELDHIEPLSRGGAHDVDNAAPSCCVCNVSKNNTQLLVWLAVRASRQAA